MYFPADEWKQEALESADLSNPASMVELFNAVANCYYLAGTKAPADKIEQYLEYYTRDWAGDQTGDEWESIDDCVDCAEAAAQQVLDSEDEELFELQLMED